MLLHIFVSTTLCFFQSEIVLTVAYLRTIRKIAKIDTDQNKINLTTVKYGDIAYLVSFKEKSVVSKDIRVYEDYCTGAIVRPRVVISAAHCFVDRYTEIVWNSKAFQNKIVDRSIVKSTYVVAGQVRVSSERIDDDRPSIPQWRSIEAVFVPETYHFPESDLAVVKIIRKYEYNPHIKPIPYAHLNEEYKGRPCLIAGFAKTTEFVHVPLYHVVKSNIQVLNDNECQSLIPNINSKTMLCSASTLPYVFEGEAGGPLVCKDETSEVELGVLIGITSSRTSTNATVYSRISAFEKFIDNDEGHYLKSRIGILVILVLFLGIIQNVY